MLASFVTRVNLEGEDSDKLPWRGQLSQGPLRLLHRTSHAAATHCPPPQDRGQAAQHGSWRETFPGRLLARPLTSPAVGLRHTEPFYSVTVY